MKSAPRSASLLLCLATASVHAQPPSEGHLDPRWLGDGGGPGHTRRLDWPLPIDRPPELEEPIAHGARVLVVLRSGMLLGRSSTGTLPRPSWKPWPDASVASGAPPPLPFDIPLRAYDASWRHGRWTLWLVDTRPHGYLLRQRGSGWRQIPLPIRSPEEPRDLRSLVLLPDGRLLLGWRSGLLQWFDEEALIASRHLGRPLRHLLSSTTSGRLLATLDDGSLLALAPGGEVLWRYASLDPPAAPPATDGTHVWLLTEHGQSIALRMRDGTPLRILGFTPSPRALLRAPPSHAPLPAASSGSPTLGFAPRQHVPLLLSMARGHLLAVAPDGSARFAWARSGLVAIDAEHGVRWRRPLREGRAPMASLLVDAEGRTLVLDLGGTLSLFDQDGAPLWRRTYPGLQASNTSPPLLVGGPRGWLAVERGGRIVPMHFRETR